MTTIAAVMTHFHDGIETMEMRNKYYEVGNKLNIKSPLIFLVSLRSKRTSLKSLLSVRKDPS